MLERITNSSWSEIFSIITDVIHFQLFELGDSPISIGKLLGAVLLLVISYIVSRQASRIIDRKIFVKFDIEESLRYTLSRFLFYLFLGISCLMSLHALNFPVTIFTVLGGALAVGVGFGSQNLVNNFISGVLVMVERPIRVGDYIEVDGTWGRVLNIGIRSTVVQTGTQAIMMMPNTTFIEKSLINWTMSKVTLNLVRIGVAYGTDTERLRQLVMDCVGAQVEVLNDPPVFVRFADFGDSALIFDIGFYLAAVNVPNRLTIASNIRYSLNALFIKEGIEIPFPQRQVRMLN